MSKRIKPTRKGRVRRMRLKLKLERKGALYAREENLRGRVSF